MQAEIESTAITLKPIVMFADGLRITVQITIDDHNETYDELRARQIVSCYKEGEPPYKPTANDLLRMGFIQALDLGLDLFRMNKRK